eukprot:CAMPEP_0117676944 /NCGR_PEP_ID=MMETSP0804-20121206/16481_1 /TAXON_ID=1074897 /ORGANISM="Tetraselmis astigmatica, Strain CCMP880" /LENGTH=137 /DNA_ID=CAMNT_0005486193 /DNA_START=748 /DNA_END=1161 /DNA_ORIENTATION=-
MFIGPFKAPLATPLTRESGIVKASCPITRVIWCNRQGTLLPSVALTCFVQPRAVTTAPGCSRDITWHASSMSFVASCEPSRLLRNVILQARQIRQHWMHPVHVPLHPAGSSLFMPGILKNLTPVAWTSSKRSSQTTQ